MLAKEACLTFHLLIHHAINSLLRLSCYCSYTLYFRKGKQDDVREGKKADYHYSDVNRRRALAYLLGKIVVSMLHSCYLDR